MAVLVRRGDAMVRRALAMAAIEQYARLVINLALFLAVSRALTPAEVGVGVIGTGIMLIVLGLREFATSDFLIRRDQVTPQDVRSAFTVVFLLTGLIASATCVLAPWFGALYGEPKLASFLRIVAIAGLIESVALPVTGLLRRDIAFTKLAFINTMSTFVNAVMVIALAVSGFSFMSFAWAALGAAITTTGLSLYCRPAMASWRPGLRSWRAALTFGAYNGTSFLINRVYESLPQLVLGQLLSPGAVGLYNRANVASDIPDKIILTSIVSVAFPALAAESRSGRDLKALFLGALGQITVLYWPAVILLVILAHPIVSLLLGEQWLAVAPVLQIMAFASCAWVPVVLASPVLLAVGANRDRVLADLIGRSVAAVILCASAWFGIMAMAACKLVALPFQMIVSLCFVRRHIAFRWGELGAAVEKSAIVTAGSTVGPIFIVAQAGMDFALPPMSTAMVVLAAAGGWLVTALLTRHPILLELQQIAHEAAKRLPAGWSLGLDARPVGQRATIEKPS
jgi:O-antigen/teichoic acid export membrane protein